MGAPDAESRLVTVVDLDHGQPGWPGKGAVAFQAWLSEKLAQIPPEYLGAAKINIDDGITIEYRRPETVDEMATRELALAKQKAQDREYRRAEYESLKAEFE